MIVLTGVSGGIGKDILPYLLEMDQMIGIYNRNKPDLIPREGLALEQLNLENSADVRAFARKIEKQLKKITLIHLAALKIDGLAANYAEADWERVIGVNLKGNFILTQALLPYMMREGWGRIIHFSSLGGVNGDAGTIAYSTSKTGLMGMSRVLAKEYARFNITSNVLVLGHYDTGLYTKLDDDQKKVLLNQVPSKMLGKVSNIANAIKFLIMSEYVNGASINIDGGI